MTNLLVPSVSTSGEPEADAYRRTRLRRMQADLLALIAEREALACPV